MHVRPRLVLWVLALLLSAGSRAEAQLDCGVPTRERSAEGAVRGPALVAFRRSALAVEAIVKRNAAFMAGVRPIRVRTTIDYASGPPRSAIVNTVAYNQGAWTRAGCDVIPEADRGGGISDGGIHIVINDPRSFLGGTDSDGVLEVFTEPKLTGQFAGFPEYDGLYVLLSRENRVPWVPVTAAEVLDREERRLAREVEEFEKERQRPGINEADIQKSYEALLKIAPAQAEAQRAAMLKIMVETRQRMAEFITQRAADLARKREALAAYRASFDADGLRRQARVGFFPDGRARVDDPNGRALVKVDPTVERLAPDSIHFMRVFVNVLRTDPVPGRWQWMEQSKDTLDLQALFQLIQ
jgi:hypothetical protein